MSDLFDAAPGLEPLPLPSAELLYQRQFYSSEFCDEVLQRLIAETPWRSESITVWGKTHLQPRLTAWFGDARREYGYSGIRMSTLPWTPLLRDMKVAVESACGRSFNSVLLNYYRDGRDSVGMHSDDESELGTNPCIASLSLGETRTMVFKRRIRNGQRPVRIALESGSLLIMAGPTQSHWLHGVDKETRPCGPRVNLTFRMIRS